MAVITISRGCFSHGKEIAENVAKMLTYDCVSQEILMEASQFFHVPEKKLMESIHDAPGILDRITHAREKFLSCIQAALLEHIKKDNVVYHGYAGHLLIPGISHVLKVRVIAEMEDRIAFLQERRKMSRDEALDFIKTEDTHRAEWNHYIYKADTSDPRLYDMVLNVGKLKIQDACEIICTAARMDSYRSTPESEKMLGDLAMSSHVKAALQEICDAEVSTDDGVVSIKVSGQKLRKTGVASPELQAHVREQIREDLTREIMEAIRGIHGIKDVIFDVDLPYYT
jgi:cytidylate kinase